MYAFYPPGSASFFFRVVVLDSALHLSSVTRLLSTMQKHIMRIWARRSGFWYWYVHLRFFNSRVVSCCLDLLLPSRVSYPPALCSKSSSIPPHTHHLYSCFVQCHPYRRRCIDHCQLIHRGLANIGRRFSVSDAIYTISSPQDDS